MNSLEYQCVPGNSDGSEPRFHLNWRFGVAMQMALGLHFRQIRKGTSIPYIAHLMGVCALVLEAGGDEDQAVAALLHDAVEDQGGVSTLDTIRHVFGERVALAVKSCSDSAATNPATKLPWRERKEKYLAHLRSADRDALIVAAADKLHNARAVVSDYRELGDSLWARFNASGQDQLWYYRELAEVLLGTSAPKVLVSELDRVTNELGRLMLASTENRATCASAESPKKFVIDEAFIQEWAPQYDRIGGDEPEYERLVSTVAEDIASTGTLARETFLAIWKWKGAMRVIRFVHLDDYEERYAEAIRQAVAAPLQQRMDVLIGTDTKLPGVEAATASTLLHFMDPEKMPIIDVRTVGVLFAAGLIPSLQKDLGHYDEFRRAILRIQASCSGRSLREIDRALFAYHKEILDKSGQRVYGR